MDQGSGENQPDLACGNNLRKANPVEAAELSEFVQSAAQFFARTEKSQSEHPFFQAITSTTLSDIQTRNEIDQLAQSDPQRAYRVAQSIHAPLFRAGQQGMVWEQPLRPRLHGQDAHGT